MKLLDLFFAGRPLLLIPLWSVWLVSLKYHHVLAGKQVALSDLQLLGSLTCCGLCALYLNQIYDRDTDAVNQKVGFLQNRLLTDRTLGLLAFICAIAAVVLISPFPLVSRTIVAILLASAWLYSTPPIRMKDRPWLGFLSNAVAIGLFPAFSVMPEISLHNAHLMGWDNPFLFFFCIGSIYLLTTIPDVTGDYATGKRTVAVAAGQSTTTWLALVSMLIALGFALRSRHDLLALLTSVSALLTAASLIFSSERMVLFAIKFPILLLTILAGVWYPLYGAIVVALLVATRAYYAQRFKVVYPQLA